MKMRIGASLGRLLVLGSLTTAYVSVVACGAASASGPPSLGQVKSLVTALFSGYDSTSGSPTAQYKYDYAHDYPGSFDEAAFFSCAKKSPNAGYSDSITPNLSTVIALSGWHVPLSLKSQDKEPILIAGQIPKGNIYQVEIFVSPNDGSSSYNTNTHLTILNGKAYFFWGPYQCSTASSATPLHVVSIAQGASIGGELASYTASKPKQVAFSITTAKPQTILVNTSLTCQTTSGANVSTNNNLHLSLPVTNRALSLPAGVSSCYISVIAYPNTDANSVTVSLEVATG
jgi:hypothetical protein